MFRDIALARSSDDAGKTLTSSIVHHDGWELNACPIAGATMAVAGKGSVHVAWFTEYEGEPNLLYASSADKGRSFTKPQVIDSKQKLAKHAHLVAMGEEVAIVWDDANSGKPVIKWGIASTSTPRSNSGIQARFLPRHRRYQQEHGNCCPLG